MRRIFIVVSALLALTACRPAAGVGPRHIIGDSLTDASTAELESHYDTVDAQAGRTLASSGSLIVQALGADCLAIALGTNDVAGSTLARMRRDVANTAAATAGLPCVIFVTVTTGASPFYHGEWSARARYWNELVYGTGRAVADWEAVSRDHPEYFLADGLHLTEQGRAAYARNLAIAASTVPGGNTAR